MVLEGINGMDPDQLMKNFIESEIWQQLPVLLL